MRDIYDILAGRSIVYGEADLGLIVVWNGSHTFEVFVDLGDGNFKATDVFSLVDIPNNLAEARWTAMRYFIQLEDEAA